MSFRLKNGVLSHVEGYELRNCTICNTLNYDLNKGVLYNKDNIIDFKLDFFIDNRQFKHNTKIFFKFDLNDNTIDIYLTVENHTDITEPLFFLMEFKEINNVKFYEMLEENANQLSKSLNNFK